jgi:hypothetical protein
LNSNKNLTSLQCICLNIVQVIHFAIFKFVQNIAQIKSKALVEYSNKALVEYSKCFFRFQSRSIVKIHAHAIQMTITLNQT